MLYIKLRVTITTTISTTTTNCYISTDFLLITTYGLVKLMAYFGHEFTV